MPFGRAVERNHARLLMVMGDAGGGERREDTSLSWSIGGSPIAYHNCVVPAALVDADAEIDASKHLMAAKGVPGSWHVGPSVTPDGLRALLERHGFEGGPEPGMARSLEGPLPDGRPPDGLTVQRVEDAATLHAFGDVLASGFGEGEPEARWVESVYAKIGFRDPAWHHWLARLDGEPVGTATLFVHPRDVGGIYFVCTSPAHRRRGIGGAVTLSAMRHAAAIGCDLAVLGSSPMGHRLYEGLGFETVCDIGVYEWSP